MDAHDYVAPIRDKAIELLEIGWTQDHFALGKDGVPCEDDRLAVPTREKGCAWCLSGAIHAAINEVAFEEGLPSLDFHHQALFDTVHNRWEHHHRPEGWAEMTVFNDVPGRTQAEVIASLRNIN